MDLKTFLFEKLSYYHKSGDPNKDSNGKGTLERFLNVLGIELQTEVIEKIENTLEELDPETAADKFLPLIAYTLGEPTNVLGTTAGLRTRLLHAISLYKIKGTVRSYRLLFALLGYDIDLVEHIPPRTRYDSELDYDDNHRYDTDWCKLGCIEYSITYTDAASTGPMTPEQIASVTAAIKKDLEPINAKLKEITYEAP